MNRALQRFFRQQDWPEGMSLVFIGGEPYCEKQLRFTIFGINANTQSDILEARLFFNPDWPSELGPDKQQNHCQ